MQTLSLTSTTDHSLRKGFSLVEVLVASMLTAMLALGAMTTIGAVARTRFQVAQRLKSHNMAQQLMEEVLKANYSDPAGANTNNGLDPYESSAKRSNFDDVDDFNGWNATPPVDANGIALPDCTDWRREVIVTWTQPGNLIETRSDTGLKKICVRITAPDGMQTEIFSLRCSYGTTKQPPLPDTTIITWAEAELQIGKNTPTTLNAINLLNDGYEQQPVN